MYQPRVTTTYSHGMPLDRDSGESQRSNPTLCLSIMITRPLQAVLHIDDLVGMSQCDRGGHFAYWRSSIFHSGDVACGHQVAFHLVDLILSLRGTGLVSNRA